MASLGFDFGTSNTFIVKRANDGNLTVLNWSSGANSYYEGNRFDDRPGPFTSVGIPTRIGYAGTDSEGNKIWKVGAQTSGIDEKNVCINLKTKINITIRSFLRNIVCSNSSNNNIYDENVIEEGFECKDLEIEGMPMNDFYGQTFTDPQTGESFYMSAIELSKIFLTEVLKKQDVGLTSILLGQDTNPYSDIIDVDCIVIGVPSNEEAAGEDIVVSHDYGSVLADKIFKPVVDSIFGEDNSVRIVTADEPILAVNAYFKRYPQQTRVNDYILVVDIGGGTSDYALVRRTINGYEVCCNTRGGTNPAGNSFDAELKMLLMKTGANFSDANIRLAKENLFPSFDAYCRLNGLPKENPESRRIYENQYENPTNAPLTMIKSDNNTEYKVRFQKGAVGTYNAGSYNAGSYNYYPCFKNRCNTELIPAVKSYLKGYIDTTPAHSLSQVMFVGGTCSIYPLRKEIEAAVRSVYDDINNDIKVVFWDNEDCNENDGVILTCSNIIAIGAAYQGAEENESPAVPVPDIYIQVKIGSDTKGNAIHKNIKLLSQTVKNTGVDREIHGIPVIYPEDFYNTEAERKTASKTVLFRIMRKSGDREITYPKKPFYYRLGYSNDVDCEHVVFFADVNQNGVIALFAAKDVPPIGRQHAVEKYDMKFFNSEVEPITIINSNHNLRAKAVRMYLLQHQGKRSRGIESTKNRRYNFNWKIKI